MPAARSPGEMPLTLHGAESHAWKVRLCICVPRVTDTQTGSVAARRAGWAVGWVKGSGDQTVHASGYEVSRGMSHTAW